MGLFGIFGGKPPEELERQGDAHYKNGAFGDAKMAFEKAIDRIERRCPEKKNLLPRITEKYRLAKESLAKMHVENADYMITVEDYPEAEALYRLAMELTSDEALAAEIHEKIGRLKDLVADAAQTEMEWVGDADEEALAGDEEDESEEDADDTDTPYAYSDAIAEADPAETAGPTYYDDGVEDTPEHLLHVLVSALPEEVQEAYLGYGDAFTAGYIALNHGDFRKAVKELTRALEAHDSEKTWIPIELATAHIHMNDPVRAREILEDFLHSNPEEIRAYQLLCEIFWEAGNTADARNLLAGAPNDIQTTRPMLMLLGETLFQAGRYDQAEKVFAKCLEIHGKDEFVNRGLAKTYEAKGQIEQARDLYADILNRCVMCGAATDPIIKRRYADLCTKTGDKSPKLLELYFSLVKEDPDNRADYFRQIATLYDAQGKEIEARKYRKLSKPAGGGNLS